LKLTITDYATECLPRVRALAGKPTQYTTEKFCGFWIVLGFPLILGIFFAVLCFITGGIHFGLNPPPKYAQGHFVIIVQKIQNGVAAHKSQNGEE